MAVTAIDAQWIASFDERFLQSSGAELNGKLKERQIELDRYFPQRPGHAAESGWLL
jgi:hypothetical protein